ncbi:MAG: dUTP diphosphatase [Syntrophobacteraceae bacterium]
MKLKVKRMSEAAIIPKYSHAGDAGMDLCAAEMVEIAPGRSELVPTGLSIELPPGSEAQIRPRSGLALRYGITVLNSPGTIDQGYRGEIGVILINHGHSTFRVEPGARIAQMVITPILIVEIEESESLSDTARAAGGFGSTGIKNESA